METARGAESVYSNREISYLHNLDGRNNLKVCMGSGDQSKKQQQGTDLGRVLRYYQK